MHLAGITTSIELLTKNGKETLEESLVTENEEQVCAFARICSVRSVPFQIKLDRGAGPSSAKDFAVRLKLDDKEVRSETLWRSNERVLTIRGVRVSPDKMASMVFLPVGLSKEETIQNSQREEGNTIEILVYHVENIREHPALPGFSFIPAKRKRLPFTHKIGLGEEWTPEEGPTYLYDTVFCGHYEFLAEFTYTYGPRKAPTAAALAYEALKAGALQKEQAQKSKSVDDLKRKVASLEKQLAQMQRDKAADASKFGPIPAIPNFKKDKGADAAPSSSSADGIDWVKLDL
ncbi:uncharacterized protein PFL1_02648 [Pseudozyma flocculosa PF-1]|uniref:Uncharacterized protein n=2 Tax=Pseudozyma flocculosa TaxID=84751 RepID=A0A5C3F1Y0_9BASI|nr:uncharacterized protein PFL1_02648 [Pseudozyma flocculosa PF-1]EPQ29975.1 hypothetical protein PFL1_02648 [Pseudozyma flocculosa PF-1]SPO37291.1 uncharacterized protein PSFLO_02764 [Pseudozyma flocculosa]